jgi:hypothetical protein
MGSEKYKYIRKILLSARFKPKTDISNIHKKALHNHYTKQPYKMVKNFALY